MTTGKEMTAVKKTTKKAKTAINDLKPKKEVKGGVEPINDRKRPAVPING